MTSVYIAGGIIVVLVIAVCYAFMLQTVTRKREQQQRLVSALENRIRNFRYLLSGFPENFLPKDLHLLVYRHLVEAAQQLVTLAPKDKSYVEELEVFTREMTEIQRRPPTNRQQRLSSVKQSKEVKHHLTELNKLVHRLHKRGKVNKTEFDSFTADVRQMVLHIAVDNYKGHAAAAETAGKPRMAIHYYTLARNLLSKEKLSGTYKTQIEELTAQLRRLEAIVEPVQAPEPESEGQEADWSEFGGDDSWKKKAIYD